MSIRSNWLTALFKSSISSLISAYSTNYWRMLHSLGLFLLAVLSVSASFISKLSLGAQMFTSITSSWNTEPFVGMRGPVRPWWYSLLRRYEKAWVPLVTLCPGVSFLTSVCHSGLLHVSVSMIYLCPSISFQPICVFIFKMFTRR